MNTANTITFMRVALSPVFFVVFFLPQWMDVPAWPVVIVLALIFTAIEVSDLIDGKVARKLDQVTDLGKLLDPFGDSFSRLTYFLCFTVSGIMPAWVFILVLYRDLGVSFIRQLQAREGVSMPARKSGKIKAWVYAVAGIAGILFYFAQLLAGPEAVPWAVETALFVLFIITGITAVWTLYDYAGVLVRRKTSD